MKAKFHDLEKFRFHIRGYPDATKSRSGAFLIPHGNVTLRCIVSDGSDWHAAGLSGQPWEHVSVSLTDRCPTWEEMSYVKSLFWNDDETVIQFHVPTSEHLNHHKFCLHLWRPVKSPIARPPGVTVAPEGSRRP